MDAHHLIKHALLCRLQRRRHFAQRLQPGRLQGLAVAAIVTAAKAQPAAIAFRARARFCTRQFGGQLPRRVGIQPRNAFECGRMGGTQAGEPIVFVYRIKHKVGIYVGLPSIPMLLLAAADFVQSTHQAVFLAGELHRRSVGQVFALAAHRSLYPSGQQGAHAAQHH